MACSSSSSIGPKLPTPDIGDKPHQPLAKEFAFPQREFGQLKVVKRSFQPQWYSRWPWLHYLEGRDLAFCHTCVLAYQRNHLQSASLLEQSFISSGFSNWKDAVAKFSKHEGSRCHKDAVLKVQVLPASTHDVGEAFSEQLRKDRL